MCFSKKLLCFLAAFGLLATFGMPSLAFAQNDEMAEISISSSSDAAEYEVTGDCLLPLGGTLCVENNTGETIVASICVIGRTIRLGAVEAGETEYFKLPPRSPALSGVSGEFKARGRGGSGSKPIQFN